MNYRIREPLNVAKHKAKKLLATLNAGGSLAEIVLSVKQLFAMQSG